MTDLKYYFIVVLIFSYKVTMRLSFFPLLFAFQVSSVNYRVFYHDLDFPLLIYEEVLHLFL